MRPQTLPNVADRSCHTLPLRVLVAIDDTEHADRALSYVGTLLREAHDVQITLFHVLKPMPRELLEHGGSEDPIMESRLGAELQRDQDNWVRAESQVEHPILAKALDRLGRTGFPRERVTLKFGQDDDITQSILDEARAGDYGTIVVSRPDSSGVKRLFGGGTTEHLMRDAAGYALWVV